MPRVLLNFIITYKELKSFHYFHVLVVSFQSTYPFKYIFSSSAAKKGSQERKEGADKTTDDKKSTEANNVSI
jgi:hypothetical protein